MKNVAENISRVTKMHAPSKAGVEWWKKPDRIIYILVYRMHTNSVQKWFEMRSQLHNTCNNTTYAHTYTCVYVEKG